LADRPDSLQIFNLISGKSTLENVGRCHLGGKIVKENRKRKKTKMIKGKKGKAKV
jgi:hypothetical protein